MAQSSRPAVDRKARYRIPPQPQPTQAPAERVENWREVFLGFDHESAVVEAERCIQCPATPCIPACPVENDIPAALWLLEHGDVAGAANKFRETNPLPDICGRICPQERLCEGECVIGKNGQPVAIGKLEAYVADRQRRSTGVPVPTVRRDTGKRVAIVGSGPAGLAAAEQIRVAGHEVIVYEAWPQPGGILRYGIPGFKLAKEMVDEKIDFLRRRLGVSFITNTTVGKEVSLWDLWRRFNVVLLAYGAGVGANLGLEGEYLPGVHQATEFLVRANLPDGEKPPWLQAPLGNGSHLVVIGGGDTAMDCVRSARRLGYKAVTVLYRRSESEMVGREEERSYAADEGVRFEFLTTPLRFLGDGAGRLRGVECAPTQLGDADASGRPAPMIVSGSEFVIEADAAVLATGYEADPGLVLQNPELSAGPKGLIRLVDEETGATSIPRIYAAGDNVDGADLVVTAIARAKKAAKAILDELER